MEQLCQNMDEIDESSLLETEAEVEVDESEERTKVTGTSK